jgi:hypothetical protein
MKYVTGPTACQLLLNHKNKVFQKSADKRHDAKILQAIRIQFRTACWTQTNGKGPMWLKAVKWYKPQSKTNGTATETLEHPGSGMRGPLLMLSHPILVLWLSEYSVTWSRGCNQRPPASVSCIARKPDSSAEILVMNKKRYKWNELL